VVPNVEFSEHRENGVEHIYVSNAKFISLSITCCYRSCMDLRRVRTFVTVAELGSVSRAALRLHISQPGLSRQIQDLQHEFKLKLFEKVGRRLILTTEGEQLLAECRSLLNHANSIGEQAQLLRGGDTGVLRVATSPAQIEALSKLLPVYAARYPNVQVRLIEAVGAAVRLLERGEVHVALSVVEAAAVQDTHLGVHPVAPLVLVAAFHSSYPLEHGAIIDIRRIASHPVLLPDSSFNARKILDAVCQRARLDLDIRFESRSLEALLALAESGTGIAIVTTAIRADHYALRMVRIVDRRTSIKIPQAIVWDKRRMLPRYARDFCDMLAAEMRKPFVIETGAPRSRQSKSAR
jgi:DNA-binding transcriptional LysR family regulator